MLVSKATLNMINKDLAMSLAGNNMSVLDTGWYVATFPPLEFSQG